MSSDLCVHLMRPLVEDGHGFETGIPVTSLASLVAFHAEDHLNGAWWQDVLTHAHERERAAEATEAGGS